MRGSKGLPRLLPKAHCAREALRTSFKWEPVYVALFFDANPTWFFRRHGVAPPDWVWPSARYKHLLLEARQLVISPPASPRPFSSEDLQPLLDELRLEIEGTPLPHPAARELWNICLSALDKAEVSSRKGYVD